LRVDFKLGEEASRIEVEELRNLTADSLGDLFLAQSGGSRDRTRDCWHEGQHNSHAARDGLAYSLLGRAWLGIVSAAEDKESFEGFAGNLFRESESLEYLLVGECGWHLCHPQRATPKV
jgi:hypothetical protein